MSSPLSSPDLSRLVDDGYTVSITGGHVCIADVPYVTNECVVAYGVLVSPLSLAGDITTRPSDHVVTFAGAAPCDRRGQPLAAIINGSARQVLGDGLVVDHTFSSKPTDGSGYANYYDKMTAYINILLSEAQAVDPNVIATPFKPRLDRPDDSVFCYTDTASSRAKISAITDKLRVGPVGVIGLGGSSGYILDLVAKTPASEIRLFDGDKFIQHNAFRAPGAATIAELGACPYKVDYFATKYSAIHRHILPHASFIDAHNVEELRHLSFAFVSMDDGEAKGIVLDTLRDLGIPFIDVGMGLYEIDGALAGIVRVTTSTPQRRDHVSKRIARSNLDDDLYSTNIQTADLNALSAVLAVIKWKKLLGFYNDLDREHHCSYEIDGNTILNDDLD
jgi:hypothetical protein